MSPFAERGQFLPGGRWTAITLPRNANRSKLLIQRTQTLEKRDENEKETRKKKGGGGRKEEERQGYEEEEGGTDLPQIPNLNVHARHYILR